MSDYRSEVVQIARFRPCHQPVRPISVLDMCKYVHNRRNLGEGYLRLDPVMTVAVQTWCTSLVVEQIFNAFYYTFFYICTFILYCIILYHIVS